jgi:hypothetical protein
VTAVAPDRLGLVIVYARQLGRRPTSNEIRALLRCGRATANTLLEELAQVDPYPAPGGATLLALSDTQGTVDQQEATGPQPVREWPQVAPHPAPTRLLDRVTARLRDATRPHRTTRPAPAPQTAPQAAPPPVHRAWLLLLALPAFVAVWGGWVGLGGLAGFGPVHLLPGILDHLTVNLAVTLPAGMEIYGVIGLRVWLSGRTRTTRTRTFAAWSTCVALTIGCMGQVAYHVLARPATGAPMYVTVCVACLPVVILGMGAALFHLVGDDQRTPHEDDQ